MNTIKKLISAIDNASIDELRLLKSAIQRAARRSTTPDVDDRIESAHGPLVSHSKGVSLYREKYQLSLQEAANLYKVHEGL